VYTATGRDSEHLLPHAWNVADLEGKKAIIQVVDQVKGGWGHVLVDHIVQSDAAPDPVAEAAALLARAETSVQAAGKRVRDDPERPVYHLLPPANWMNDPNGPVFWKGWYHVFYQHNPYGDSWGNMHWGHWRSKDLVRWEQQPIALGPSLAQGEDHVFSGCAAVTRDGQLMLCYTSIGPRLPEQWAAVPEDDDLVKWKKHPGNPLLTEELHGETRVHEWRDPFVFCAAGQTYMVLGGNLNASKGGEAVVNVYRAEKDDLTAWKYLGVLFRHPDKGVANVECPLFFPLGKKWVLVTSQGRPVHWFAGSLDEKAMRFTAETRGATDYGDYYAPNCLEDPKGRRVLWGWVQGFRPGRGWNGCLTLPRVLALDAGNRLVQSPAPELEKLRRDPFPHVEGVTLNDSFRVLDGVRGDTMEIRAAFEPGDATSFGLRVRRSADGKNGVVIRCDGKQIDAAGAKAPLPAGQKAVELRVFLDRCVLEVYAGGECLTRVVYPGKDDLGVEAFAQGGTATLRRLEAWPMGSIWAKGER
jgi:beta-fructofuranosidase